MRRAFLTFTFVFSVLLTSRGATFQNPIIGDGADPWILFKDGVYHYTQTTGGSVRVRKAPRLTGPSGIGNTLPVTVFTPAAPNNRNVWAPEIHFLRGKWYVYFAADNGDNANHRMYVAEGTSNNSQGNYVSKGKIFDPTSDRWAIDGTVLERPDGSLFFIWSGWPGSVDGQQNLYIAPMSDPWTISGPRVRISTPTYSWEGWINEGPQVIQRDDKIFVVYSANASWTDEYCFGLLTCSSADVLNAASWKKTTSPVFRKTTSVFGPGHGSFTKSVDGKEDWLIYHAAKTSGSGWSRNVRLQSFTWNSDGSPHFGAPLSTNISLNVPSGEGSNRLTINSTTNGAVKAHPAQTFFVQNAEVTLAATPSVGFAFSSWQGITGANTNPVVLRMDSDKTVSAIFTNLTVTPPTISAEWTPQGGLRLMMTGAYGAAHSLQASSNFLDWSELTNFLMPSNPVIFYEPATNGPSRFYRVSEPD